ncbi:autotransporter domain-containing protein [Pseudomonas sp. R5-89-07]|uniref:autotransporter outer membrane beta-barrel domain-containing protein n=1 Tax=Pseudomonas sp. R5-89-07 TaxID=658644 RepID=UPI000F572D9F|nr:autotransporter outer membrane beta-barrel domain-containing protein [Pseudomonas sp. R5-89-07]AZF08149.1 Outer membrane autotransporter barrel [Pseudomonas sp. R5-89-07]
MPVLQKTRVMAVALLAALASIQNVHARGDMPPEQPQTSFKPYYPQLPGFELDLNDYAPPAPIPVPTHFYLASGATSYNGLQFAQGIDTQLAALRDSGGLTIEQKNQLRELQLLLASQPSGELGAALEQLAGSQNANLAAATQKSSGQVSAGLLSALRGMPDQEEGRFWVQGLGHSSNLAGLEGSQNVKQGLRGLLIGADWSLDSAWRMGVVGGRSSSTQNAKRFRATVDSWHLGGYAVRQDGPLALRLGAIHSRHDGNNQRNIDIAFLDYQQQLKGRYSAQSQNAFAEAGYKFGNDTFNAEPFASVGYQRYQRNGFKETGGEAALNVGAQTQENFNSTLGVRLATAHRFDNQMSLTPHLSAQWKHLYGDVSSHVHQSSRLIGLDGTDGLDSQFTIRGAALDRDSLGLSAGLDLALSSQHTLGLAYTGEAGSSSRSQGLTGHWRMEF